MLVKGKGIHFAIGDNYTYIQHSFLKRHALLNMHIDMNEHSLKYTFFLGKHFMISKTLIKNVSTKQANTHDNSRSGDF